ncbi:MAG: hypothetical protein VX589_16835 [Myxococcota bacterium]|nr:hypothetical protein [Myxococcota bacterium]
MSAQMDAPSTGQVEYDSSKDVVPADADLSVALISVENRQFRIGYASTDSSDSRTGHCREMPHGTSVPLFACGLTTQNVLSRRWMPASNDPPKKPATSGEN